jgi:hypothetical protein
MRITTTLAAGAALALMFGTGAAAQSGAIDPGGISPREAVSWLSAQQGLAPEFAQEGDTPAIRVVDGDVTWGMFFYNCEQSRCRAVQFHISFQNPAVTEALAADWNRSRRFVTARAEMNPSPELIGEYDLYLPAGYTWAQLSENLELWRAIVPLIGLQAGYYVLEDAQ